MKARTTTLSLLRFQGLNTSKHRMSTVPAEPSHWLITFASIREEIKAQEHQNLIETIKIWLLNLSHLSTLDTELELSCPSVTDGMFTALFLSTCFVYLQPWLDRFPSSPKNRQ